MRFRQSTEEICHKRGEREKFSSLADLLALSNSNFHPGFLRVCFWGGGGGGRDPETL